MAFVHTITFGAGYLNMNQSIIAFRNLKSNENIRLKILCDKDAGYKFSETFELRKIIFENITHIEHLAVDNNRGLEKNERLSWFYFFLVLIQFNQGDTTSFSLENSHEFVWTLQQANKFADALRANNNKNDCQIESFHLDYLKCTSKVFQPILDSLLDVGVPELGISVNFLSHENENDNDNIHQVNFSNLSTSTKLKKLMFDPYMSNLTEENAQLAWKNFFNSVKFNTGIEELHSSLFLQERETIPLMEMLSTNTTLLNVHINTYLYGEQLRAVIKTETGTNRNWKQYIIQRCEEKKTSAARDNSTTTHLLASTPSLITPADALLAKAVEEEKKIFKMRTLFHLFMKKPVMRDTIVYHSLTENNTILDIDYIRLSLHKKKRKHIQMGVLCEKDLK